jgi:hypothetical protein
MSEPIHDLIDFVGLAAQLTNEQKMLGCLERIEQLLIARVAPVSELSMSQFASKDDLEAAQKAEKIKALQDRVPARSKK